MPYFFVWLRNHTDMRDDEVLKIKAASKATAKTEAGRYYFPNRFSIHHVYTRHEFKKFEPWWHAHFWGRKAHNE